MRHLTFAAIGLAFGAFAFMSPASAEHMKDGSMFLVGPDGSMKSLPRGDKAKILQMIKAADPIGEDMVVFVWGGKFYMMKNHKMDDGRMSFDAFGIHGLVH
jgi:hypothetical protein